MNKKVQFIGNSAFAGTNIKNLQMGENVLYIGNKVFASCTSLKTIYIPANVKGINANAFNDCSSLRKSVWLQATKVIVQKMVFCIIRA